MKIYIVDAAGSPMQDSAGRCACMLVPERARYLWPPRAPYDLRELHGMPASVAYNVLRPFVTPDRFGVYVLRISELCRLHARGALEVHD